MANNFKITDKPIVTLTVNDSILVSQNGSTKSTTLSRLKALFFGNAALNTEAQDTNSAINEVNDLANSAKSISESVNNKIGTATLETTSQNVVGGINEVNAKVGSETLETVAQNTTGAINELKDGVDNLTESVAENTSSLNAKANLATTPQITTNSINYYVSATGNDENDGLTLQSPKRSINKILEELPNILNHVINIYISDGIYNERVVMPKSFEGIGRINFIGNKESPANVKFDSFDFTRISLFCELNGVNLTSTINNGVLINSTKITTIGYCLIDGVAENTSVHGINVSSAFANIHHTTIKNRTCGIVANMLSTVLSNGNNGENNNFGINALYGGTLIKVGSQPTGVTSNEVYSYGGVIR